MQKLQQIIVSAFQSTRSSPYWWLLALLQVAALSLISRFTRPVWPHPVWLGFFIGAVAILPPITVWLWLDMEAKYNKCVMQVSAKLFVRYWITAGSSMLCSMVVTFLVRLIYPNWVFFVLTSSFIAATSTLAILYAVICGQNFFVSWTLALDTWHKKISLPLMAAVCLMIVHGIFFAVAREIRISLMLYREFSVFIHSATIWVILFVILFLGAFLGALVNCFLVFLFLEIINRQKARGEKDAGAKEAEVLPVASV